MRFDSIRFRISVLYTIVLGIILVIYSSILYFSLSYSLNLDFEKQLKGKSLEVIARINSESSKKKIDNNITLFLILNKVFSEQERRLSKDHLFISTVEGKTIIESSHKKVKNLSDFVIPGDYSGKGKSWFCYATTLDDDSLRLITVPFNIGKNRSFYFSLGTSLKPINKILKRERLLIAVDIAIVLLITSFVGQFFVSRILKPVKDIAITSDKITKENLSARIESTHLDYEMQHLVDSINSMIERIEKAYNHIANFSLDVSHELKTPLAIIRSESELALIKERKPEEYQKVLQSNLDQIERMRRLVEDLLLLAKVDHETEVFSFERLELVKFLKKLCNNEKILASQKNIILSYELPDTEIFVNADRLHLGRLFINLIANSIKFTPIGGKIMVQLFLEKEKVVVSVEDTGIGINKDELNKIFERFYRTEEADATSEPGCGLGLCLVQSIVTAHSGKIDVESTFGKGSNFKVELPISGLL